jgi:hypothetical protein
MLKEGEIDIEDQDIRQGGLEPVAKILLALGYRASETSSVETPFLTSSSGGFQFFVFATPYVAGSHTWFIFSASFPDFRFSLSDANKWNLEGINPVATVDKHGSARLTLSLIRNEMTVLGFTQNLGFWLHMLERFGSQLRNQS